MKSHMGRHRRKTHQIFRIIIFPVFIKMMDFFLRSKKSANIFFYNKSMFSDISSSFSKWMLGRINIFIARARKMKSFESMMIIPSIILAMIKVGAFVRTKFSYFNYGWFSIKKVITFMTFFRNTKIPFSFYHKIIIT